MSGPISTALTAATEAVRAALADSPEVTVQPDTSTLHPPCVLVGPGDPALSLAEQATWGDQRTPEWETTVIITAIPTPAPGDVPLAFNRVVTLADQIATALPDWSPVVDSVRAVATTDGRELPAAQLTLTIRTR